MLPSRKIVQNITLELSEKKINTDSTESLLENTLYIAKNENIIISTKSSIESKEDDNDKDDDDDKDGTETETDREDEDEDENEEHIVELFNVKIRGHAREYYTDNSVNGHIYTIGIFEEIGPIVGKFVNGKAVMNKTKTKKLK